MGTTDTLILDDYLDLVDAAAFLHVHPMSLRRLVKRGTIGAHLWQGKYVFHLPLLQQFKQTYNPAPGRKSLRRLL